MINTIDVYGKHSFWKDLFLFFYINQLIIGIFYLYLHKICCTRQIEVVSECRDVQGVRSGAMFQL